MSPAYTFVMFAPSAGALIAPKDKMADRARAPTSKKPRIAGL